MQTMRMVVMICGIACLVASGACSAPHTHLRRRTAGNDDAALVRCGNATKCQFCRPSSPVETLFDLTGYQHTCVRVRVRAGCAWPSLLVPRSVAEYSYEIFSGRKRFDFAPCGFEGGEGPATPGLATPFPPSLDTCLSSNSSTCYCQPDLGSDACFNMGDEASAAHFSTHAGHKQWYRCAINTWCRPGFTLSEMGETYTSFGATYTPPSEQCPSGCGSCSMTILAVCDMTPGAGPAMDVRLLMMPDQA